MLATESLRALGEKKNCAPATESRKFKAPSRDGEKRVGWRANSWTEKQILIFLLRSDQTADL